MGKGKKRLLPCICLVATACVCLTSGCMREDDAIILRFADTASTGDPDAAGNLYFAELVEERTGGRVKVEYYNNGQLGSDKVITQATIVGTLDMAKCSAGNFTEYSDALLFTELPGLFEDFDHVRRMWQSDIRDQVTDQIKQELGLTVIMYDIDGGEPRGIGSARKEIRVPKDTKGMRIRTTGSAVEVALFRAWDASAISMEYSELYTGMQQNLADGFYLQSHFAVISKFEEAITCFTPVEQSWVTSVKVLGKDAEKKLGPELYQIVIDCGREAELYKDELWKEAEMKAYQAMRDAGVTIVELSREEKTQWDEASQEIWGSFVGEEIPQELIDRINELR